MQLPGISHSSHGQTYSKEIPNELKGHPKAKGFDSEPEVKGLSLARQPVRFGLAFYCYFLVNPFGLVWPISLFLLVSWLKLFRLVKPFGLV